MGFHLILVLLDYFNDYNTHLGSYLAELWTTITSMSTEELRTLYQELINLTEQHEDLFTRFNRYLPSDRSDLVSTEWD